MEKEKQIEEMAELMDISFDDVQTECLWYDYCEDCKYYHTESTIDCKCYGVAETLYNAGYRKHNEMFTIKMNGQSELQKVFDELLEGNTYVTIKEKEVEIEQAKQEVAREIFAEIEVETELYDRYEPISTLINFLAELKKKYLGE